jgi:hypothetical protein
MLHPQIVEKFGRRFDASDQQVVSCAGASDIEQVAFGIVDLLQIGIVADRLDALLPTHFPAAILVEGATPGR